MTRAGCILSIAMLVGLSTGCVERRYVITTDPPGAAVYRNGEFIGNSPVDDQFVYYGNYHYTIRKEGFATLQVNQNIPMPWYEYWPAEFVSEVLVPWHIEDVHYFCYPLQPLPPANIPALLGAGQNLRNEGRSIGPKTAPPPPTPAIGPPAVAPPAQAGNNAPAPLPPPTPLPGR